jgi:monofunctional glycosyltransferase
LNGHRRHVAAHDYHRGSLKSNLISRRSAVALAVLLCIMIPVAGVGLYWLLTFPDVRALAHINPRITSLMQARMLEHGGIKPSWVWTPLSRISPHLQRAVIAAEDASFYEHEGFDWEAIRQAIIKDLCQGTLATGGSTITQQLAKNLYLSPEKTLLRKAREALIARELEHQLGKRRILELYLNVVEWGRGVYGAEAAARHHFRKSSQELTAEEAALLAAILPSPRHYDPIRMTRYLSVRQQQILRRIGKRHRPTARSALKEYGRILPGKVRTHDIETLQESKEAFIVKRSV